MMIANGIAMKDSEEELKAEDDHHATMSCEDITNSDKSDEITFHGDEIEGIASEPTEFGLQEIRHAMLTRVATSDAYFRHQLITDPDLTFNEKFTIASELLDSKPSVFLSRYGKYLVPDDLTYFDRFRGDYTIDFHLNDINKRFDTAGKDKKTVKNRRFEAMRRLMSEGEYFSDEEMKKRDPLLFEEMIGQYQTNEDVADAVSAADLSLSEVLLRHLQAVQNNELYEQQQNKQQTSKEEFDSEDDEDDDNEIDDEKESDKDDKEKLALRNEFVEIMQQRFLSGEDMDFDYCEVDNNEDFDALDMVNRDEEDRYFADSPDFDFKDDNDDDDC